MNLDNRRTSFTQNNHFRKKEKISFTFELYLKNPIIKV